MKKTSKRLRSLFAALAALVLAVILTVPAFAVEGGFADLYYRMNDSAGVLTEDEDSELEDALEELSLRQSFDVTIATVESLESVGYDSMEASLDTPFKAAALTVCALCAYGADKAIGQEMLNWLRGPRPLNGQDISFLNDRFRDGKSYIPFSYFVGASPENGYTPRQPFTLLVGSNHTSYVEDGYCKLFIPCGGADDPRPIKLRRKGNGQWFLWEQYLMTGIRIPTSADPWA